jgi:putative ATP-dependent endonuclease of the OLD family
MKLSNISITRFRSITDAYKIEITDFNVLLGKNNEGKTNILKALILGMEIIKTYSLISRRKLIPKNIYDWAEDFPIGLQKSRKLKNKSTVIRFDFTLNDEETGLFSNRIKSSINGEISVYIELKEGNSVSVTVPKRGKNASSLSGKLIEICSFICDHFEIQYIPSVRTLEDSYFIISELLEKDLSTISDQKYIESLAYIEQMQQSRLNELSKKVKEPLRSFLPTIKTLDLIFTERYRGSPKYLIRKSISINIDDGVKTSLSNKGDGVKSLVAIAMLSSIESDKSQLIIIDEPENHLHSEAVRYINNVLMRLSQKNQVIVSTHNPIFANRSRIASNIIVESGKVIKASKVDEIRKTLGVICSDNLVYSDYVIVVEGPSDKEFLHNIFESDKELKKMLDDKVITIRSTGGTNNLKSELYALERFCCDYLVILDNDQAGKQAHERAIRELHICEEKFRFFMNGKFDCELEDLLKPSFYKDDIIRLGLVSDDSLFKNQTKKWSERVRLVADKSGVKLSDTQIAEIKNKLAKKIDLNWRDCLTENGVNIIEGIKAKVKNDLASNNS